MQFASLLSLIFTAASLARYAYTLPVPANEQHGRYNGEGEMGPAGSHAAGAFPFDRMEGFGNNNGGSGYGAGAGYGEGGPGGYGGGYGGRGEYGYDQGGGFGGPQMMGGNYQVSTFD